MGIDLKALKADQGMEDVDDFDFICYVAYGKKPLTREERASKVKKKTSSASILPKRRRFWVSFWIST